MEIQFKVWLEKKGEVIAGDGKIRLLKLIERHGSIQKAAQEARMSYRHAWGVIRKMELRSGLRLVETRAGGREGGGARLTAPGRDFLGRYAHFSEGLAEIVRKKFQEAFRDQNSPKERKSREPTADR